jgi:DNA-binding transcriptional LysR family regulator
MRLSHLNGWRAVEAVWRTGSIAEAAADLSVTRAAVASQIRAVEAALDRPLFTRGPSGLRPTEALRASGARLSTALSDLAEVQAALSHRPRANRVALSVSPTFAETWLPRHMPDLFARQPDIDLRLHSSWEVVDLHRRADIDFAIRYMGENSDPELDVLPLLNSGVVPVCTPAFAARFGLGNAAGGDAAMSLDGVPLVHIDVPTSDPDWVDWAGWRARMGLPSEAADAVAPRYVLTATSVRLALGGFGLVLGGLSDVFAAVADGALVVPFGSRSIVPGRYAHSLVWRREARLGPVQRRFRDWVSAKADQDRAILARLFGV